MKMAMFDTPKYDRASFEVHMDHEDARRFAMSDRNHLRAIPVGAEWHRPKMFRSLLIPMDLSPVSDRLVGRVALLPLAEEAQLTLLHVVPRSLPPRSQRRAEADAKKVLSAEATSLAKNLPRGVNIEPIVKVGTPAVEIAKRAATPKVELIVMGRGGGRALRDVFLGSTAERVIRRGQLPVLVVRLPPRALYRRPALALDNDQAAHGTLELLLRIIPSPRPSVEVIHAYDIPYRGMIYPSLSEDEAEEYRKDYRDQALREIENLLATSLARRRVAPVDAPSWKMHVRYGSPRTVIEKAVKKGGADLLVLGTHGHSGLAHVFLGTVAGDVLREVPCDVLVVPPRRDASETT
jgi:nucleotide-binding universal stress UspA family protein